MPDRATNKADKSPLSRFFCRPLRKERKKTNLAYVYDGRRSREKRPAHMLAIKLHFLSHWQPLTFLRKWSFLGCLKVYNSVFTCNYLLLIARWDFFFVAKKNSPALFQKKKVNLLQLPEESVISGNLSKKIPVPSIASIYAFCRS